MKYVILQPRPGVAELTRILACCIPTRHADLARLFADTHQATAAGYFDFTPTGEIRVFGRSTTLNLGPGANDAVLLRSFMRGTAAMV
jgi:hypothetical protein